MSIELLSLLLSLMLPTAASPADATSDVAARPSDPSPTIAWLPASVRRFDAEIDAAARRHGVDPRLVALVVLVESGGDPDAVSPIGAQGLMQVMPSTAARLALARHRPAPSDRQLRRPRVSLDYGALLLAQLCAELASDPLDDSGVYLVAAAYNGGIERALAHVGGAPLPKETARYAAKVRDLWRQRDEAQRTP